MKVFSKSIWGYKLQIVHLFFAVMSIAIMQGCSKSDGVSYADVDVRSVIQINVNNAAYSIKSAPDVISFSTTAINATTPYFRQYLVSGTTATATITFTLSFHTDTIGNGKYVMEGSQVKLNGKNYISLAGKTTDKVTVTKLDASKNVYSGSFSFYAYNKILATDSVLVTGAYTIQ
jgi:hypothetical protein